MTSPWEEGQSHILRRVCGEGDVVAAIIAKFNQLPLTILTFTAHLLCNRDIACVGSFRLCNNCKKVLLLPHFAHGDAKAQTGEVTGLRSEDLSQDLKLNFPISGWLKAELSLISLYTSEPSIGPGPRPQGAGAGQEAEIKDHVSPAGALPLPA